MRPPKQPEMHRLSKVLDGVFIVRVSEEDRRAVERMWSELFHVHATTRSDEWLLGSQTHLLSAIQTWVETLIQSPSHVGFIAKLASTHIGFVAVSFREHPWLHAKRSGNIDAIWVEKEARRIGLGRRLVGSVMHEMRSRKVDLLNVHAIQSQPAAQPFWQSLGFFEFAVQMRFSQSPNISRSTQGD